jgi:DNA-binding response OmpR family regulator
MAKILIAEDEQDIRDLISFTLQFAGHEVISTANGQEVYDAALAMKENPPDLILMDVRMPRMTGYEACQRIKNDVNTSQIPVVFLSAKGQEGEVKTGLQMGALDYILKPFAPDQLVARVQEILEKSS